MSQLKTRFITDSAVTTAKINDAAVTAAKLASDSVITVKILDANVTAAKLATDSVTTVKIVDANVTAAKLASDSVTTVKILDANVTAAKLASDSVTTAKILDANVTFAKLAAGVPASVLATKLMAALDFVGGFTTGVTASSDDVSTEVLAAALTDTPQTSLAALGIYTGAVSGATDPLRVLIRKAGTDQAIDDGTGDDVYGVLTEDTGVYTLSYYKADGSAYTFVLATDIDFFFVEIYNLSSLPATSLLKEGLGGVILSGASVHESTETFTLNSTDISNKYVTLAHSPAVAGNTKMIVDGEGSQLYGIDFTMGTSVRVSWSGLGLDGVLVSGDIVQVSYLY
jgi:hypothetical protein